MKQLLTSLLILFISSVFIIGCNDKTASSTTEETKSSFDLSSARKTIDSLNSAFAGYVGNADSVGLSSLYSSDATLMMPNMTTTSGRAGIQSAFAGMMGAMGPINISLKTTDLWGYEDLLTEVGTYSLTTKDGKEVDKGKYIDLWKMEDGKWKLHRDIFNSDLPCPPAPSK